MNRRCFIQMGYYILVCLFLTISTASARVCFLPDSTDCGEGDVAGSGNVDVPCQYSKCPAYNSNYQECYDERTYNNAGVNVTCKQIRCKLSKSKCEELEDNPNSSQCCNFDSASGCYYMGKCPILCNRNIYDRTTDLSGEDYTCTSCKDKNGTFYNCTAKEKECNQINSNYTSSCGDSQIAKEVEGIKDSHGNQCYTCVDKPAGCTYEYRQATTADSCGLRDFENTTKCMDTINGCMCYTQLQKVSSVDAGGAGRVTPYNKISNKSATCVDEKGVTRYQTICQGTRKSSCDTRAGYEFKPNGCVSDTYNNGFEVKGDEWGDCVKTECNYEYVHLTKNDTGTDKYDGQTLRFGENGNQCYTKGLKTTITSICSKYNGTYRCGDIYGSKCTNPGGSCKEERTCQPYYNCKYGTKCYNAIINNPSVTGRLSGTPEWGTIYNKISNNSASCVANGVRKYETLCEGTIKEKCKDSQTFVPNGCVSDIYSDGGVYVSGAIWGNCVCSADKGFYDTAEKCKKMTSENCTYHNGCYQTCKSQGYYSTQEACLTGKNTRQQCIEKYGCYVRKAVGFTITQNSPNACGGWSFYLIDADGNYVNGDGIHEAGNYSVVITGSGRLISHANVSSRQSGGGWCFGDQAENKGCEKTKLTGINRSESKAHSFQDGMDYTISVNCL